ncbi:hypothetical protein ACO2Q0_17005 [Phenylobacterium sp. VNQ135]|uniref:hypothetical protein n=1 Tax=Phenylobacterium sp. VNQ135 TaxID=3400922 RepID=UPI003C0B0015
MTDAQPPAEPHVINIENPAELEELAEALGATTTEIAEAVRMGYSDRAALERYFATPG